jgi:hypothetical protein
MNADVRDAAVHGASVRVVAIARARTRTRVVACVGIVRGIARDVVGVGGSVVPSVGHARLGHVVAGIGRFIDDVVGVFTGVAPDILGVLRIGLHIVDCIDDVGRIGADIDPEVTRPVRRSIDTRIERDVAAIASHRATAMNQERGASDQTRGSRIPKTHSISSAFGWNAGGILPGSQVVAAANRSASPSPARE